MPLPRPFALLAALVALSLTACPAKKIPGTDIEDNDDTRALLKVIEAYRVAVEARNAPGVAELCDPAFRDDGGSANPDDDLVYAQLSTTLPDRISKLSDVRLDISVRKIDIRQEENVARATYTYTVTFKLPQLTARPQSETEIKQMVFKRVGEKQWKITSGI
jgi:hypothetical protein